MRGQSPGETAPARAWKVDRSVAQGRPADPTTAGWQPAWPDRRTSAVIGAGPGRGRAGAIYLRHPDRSLLRPFRVAGLGLPRGPGGDPLPRPAGPDTHGNPCSRTSCPSPRATAWRAAACPSRRSQPSSWCRSSPWPAWRPTTRPCSPCSPRRTSAICWWMLGRLAVLRRGPPRDDDLVRVRHGLLVQRPAGHDLVSGAHRGRRPAHGRRRPGDAGGSGRPRRRARVRRSGCPAADGPTAWSPGASGWPSTGGSSRSGCCSDWRRRPGSPSCSPLRSSCSSGPADRWWRRSWSAGIGAAIPVGLLLAYNLATTGHVFHPAYDYLYQLETAPTGRSAISRTGRSRTRATSPRTPRSCS